MTKKKYLQTVGFWVCVFLLAITLMVGLDVQTYAKNMDDVSLEFDQFDIEINLGEKFKLEDLEYSLFDSEENIELTKGTDYSVEIYPAEYDEGTEDYNIAGNHIESDELGEGCYILKAMVT